HSQLKTGHPVRSAIHKQLNGRLVLRWVTTWESLLLYVLSYDIFFLSSLRLLVRSYKHFSEVIHSFIHSFAVNSMPYLSSITRF
ncbi:hypothetical protein KCU92_g9996, partial [Aureobasidium melanogenum]